jgi:hypothetical protein
MAAGMPLARPLIRGIDGPNATGLFGVLFGDLGAVAKCLGRPSRGGMVRTTERRVAFLAPRRWMPLLEGVSGTTGGVCGLAAGAGFNRLAGFTPRWMCGCGRNRNAYPALCRTPSRASNQPSNSPHLVASNRSYGVVAAIA